MAEIDKEASRVWRGRLREILNREWDPIGVAHKVEDEYDSYMGLLATMLRANAPDEELLTYLKWAEEHMGLGPPVWFDHARAMKVVAALRAVGAPPLNRIKPE